MRLAAHSLMWHSESLLCVVEHARRLGLNCLDLGALPGCGHLDLSPEHFLWSLDAVRSTLPADFSVAAITADHHGIGAPDPTERARSLAWLGNACEAARQLGAPVIGLALGAGPEAETDDYLVRAAHGLGALIELATDVRLACEIHLDNVCDSLDKAARLLDLVSSDRLGVCFDTSLLYYHRIPLTEAFQRLGDRLAHVHLRGATRDSCFHVPGRDEVDFAGLLCLLKARQYQGALSLELYGTEAACGLDAEAAARESMAYLSGLGYPVPRDDRMW